MPLLFRIFGIVMLKSAILSIWTLLTLNLYSQYTYEIKEGPLVKVSGFDLQHGFMGGLNSPQFSEFDLNRDGNLDLIVFDRADFKLYTFLRSQKNTYVYAPKYESQLPKGENIYVCRDLNSDGQMDVFTTSENGDLMIYRNISGDNDAKLVFDSVGPWYYRNQFPDNHTILYNPLSFSNANTDLPGIVDLDGDGDIDIVNYDQFNLTYMMFKDVRSEKNWDKDTFEFQNMDYCFGYFWEGFDAEIRLNTCPFDLSFPLKLKPRHVGGASCWFFDEDGDGDLEMYMANLDFKRITRLVNGKSDFNHSYDTMIVVDSLFLDGKAFNAYVFPAGYMIDVDNDGLKDMVIAPNAAYETKEKNQIHYYKNHGTKNKADFKLDRTNFIAEQMLDLGGNTSPGLIDIDSDGDLDLLVLNNGDYQESLGIHDRLALFTNTGNLDNPIYELTNNDYLKLSDSSIMGGSLAIGDIDNDGKKDILIGTTGGELYWFKKESQSWICKTKKLLNYAMQSGESSWSPAIIDYNKDGINDLLIGFYNGNIALFKGLNSSGTPTFEWITSEAWGMKANEWLYQSSYPKFSSYGYAAPTVGDIDNDGSMEIVVGGFDNILRIYHIEGHEPTDSLLASENIMYRAFDSDTVSAAIGGRLRPVLGNITGDSIPELIVGNLRGGLNFGSHINSSKTSINVNTPNLQAFHVRPNPVTKGQRFEVVSPEMNQKWEISVVNTLGQIYRKESVNVGERGVSISTEDWEIGVYFVKIQNTSKRTISTSKVLIIE